MYVATDKNFQKILNYQYLIFFLYFYQLAKMVFMEKAVLKCAMTHVQDVTTSTVHVILDVFKDGRGDSVIQVEYNNSDVIYEYLYTIHFYLYHFITIKFLSCRQNVHQPYRLQYIIDFKINCHILYRNVLSVYDTPVW